MSANRTPAMVKPPVHGSVCQIPIKLQTGINSIVHAIGIDDASVDETTQLEQMMPVPPVAGETGRIEAKHSADLAGAQPGDELLEARAGHSAAGRTTEVV